MISVMMYHQIDNVAPEHDPLGLAVKPEAFVQQMQYLSANGYKCLTLDEAFHYWINSIPAPKKVFVITFDDGFRDLYTTVQPILEPLGFTATVFLVADQIGGSSNWVGQVPQPLLSWDETRKLQNKGFSFGSHTLTHPRLSSLSDEQAMHEIKLSKSKIEERLQKSVDFFSYPYSDFDERIQRIVAECGYHAACAGERETWQLYNIWRIQCTAYDTLRSYSYKVQGLPYYLNYLRENKVIAPVARGVKNFIKTLKLKPR